MASINILSRSFRVGSRRDSSFLFCFFVSYLDFSFLILALSSERGEISKSMVIRYGVSRRASKEKLSSRFTVFTFNQIISDHVLVTTQLPMFSISSLIVSDNVHLDATSSV